MPSHKSAKEPYQRMTNLLEVVINKAILSGAGWVNGRYYTEEEINYMFPTSFEYKVENPDKRNVPR